MLVRAISGMQKASTYSNVVGSFRAAGIVRNLSTIPNSVLSIDRSEAIAIRHWDSYREIPTVEGTRNIQLVNHNPEYPRFKILSIANK